MRHDISFGDCDPAGIVFYPNIFRWMDAAFHDFLRPYGGHANLCRMFGAEGLGLADASCRFVRPMRDGDRLEVRVTLSAWSQRTLTISHEGRVGETVTFAGQEVRCLFKRTEKGMVAAELVPLRAVLERDNV